MLEGALEMIYLQVPFGKGRRKVACYLAAGMRSRKMCSLCHQCFWPSVASFWVISHANTFTFLENKELASELRAKLVQLYQSYMRQSDIKQNKIGPEWQVLTLSCYDLKSIWFEIQWSPLFVMVWIHIPDWLGCGKSRLGTQILSLSYMPWDKKIFTACISCNKKNGFDLQHCIGIL